MNVEVFDILEDMVDHFKHRGGEGGTQSSTPSSVEVGKKRRSSEMLCEQRRLKRKEGHVPRVVKNDIRRHYGTMIMNVFNGSSEDLVKSFFQTYAIPSYRVNLRPIDPASYAHLPYQVVEKYLPKFQTGMSFDGNEWLNYFNRFYSVLSPDQVFRLNDVRLVTRLSDKSSIIIMSTEVRKVQIFDVNPMEVLNTAFSFDQNNPNSQPADSCTVDRVDRRVPFSRAHSDHVVEPKLRGKFRSSAVIESIHSVATPSPPNNAGLLLSPSAKEPEAVVSAPPTSIATSQETTADNSTTLTVKLLSKPRQVHMKSMLVLVIDVNRRIESMILGDGQLSPDLLRTLENQAAALMRM